VWVFFWLCNIFRSHKNSDSHSRHRAIAWTLLNCHQVIVLAIPFLPLHPPLCHISSFNLSTPPIFYQVASIHIARFLCGLLWGFILRIHCLLPLFLFVCFSCFEPPLARPCHQSLCRENLDIINFFPSFWYRIRNKCSNPGHCSTPSDFPPQTNRFEEKQTEFLFKTF